MNSIPRQTVAIIGAGASGVTCMIQLVLKHIVNRCATPLSILIFERKKEFGPGLAYGTGQEGHLLNTKAGLMGIMPGERLHFVSWMQANEEVLAKEYPDLEFHADAYPPRMLYGNYLKAMLEEYTVVAEEHDIEVTTVSEEIVDIRLLHDHLLQLEADNGDHYYSSHAILATGNPDPSAFQDLKDLPHFLMSPWPSQTLLDTIRDKQASVSIVGSSLTAIDALITLTSNGHEGPISFFSKSGQLPRVQSPSEVPVTRQHLTLANIRRQIRLQKRSLRVKDLIRLFRKEVEEQLHTQPDWSKDERKDKDAFTLLKEDLRQAREGSSIYQNILYDMREEVYAVWKLLPADQKVLFTKWVMPFFSINRHAFPIKNGEKIAALFESGQLSMAGTGEDITWDGKQFELHIKDGTTEHAQFVVNASGPATKVKAMNDQPLLQNLLKKGYILQYEAGGIDAHLLTLQVKSDISLKPLPLYVLGQLLSGIQHEVNSLWFNVEQADLLTNHLIEQL